MAPNESGVPQVGPMPAESRMIVRPPVALAHVASPAWPAALPQGGPAEPEAARYLRALRRRWLLVLGLGSVLAGAAAAAAWFLLAPKYTAYALVHVAAHAPKTVGLTADPTEPKSDFGTYQRLQAAQLKSRYVLNAVLNRDEVRRLDLEAREPNTLVWLDDELKVDLKDGSELVTLSMSGPDPDEVVTIVNAVTKAYLTEVVSAEDRQRAQRVAEIEAIYNATQEKLREKRNTLHVLAGQLGASDTHALSQKQVTLLTNFGEVKKQEIQVRAERMKAEARLRALQARARAAGSAPAESAVEKALETDPVAKDHMRLMTELRDIIRHYDMTAVRPDEEPSRIAAQRRLRAAQKDYAERRAELAADLQKRAQRAVRAEGDGEVAAAHLDLSALQEQERYWTAEVDRSSKELQKLGGSSTEVEMLRVEIGVEQTASEKLLHQLESLRMELHSPARVKLWQEAVLQRLDRKRQIVAATLAPLGVLFGLGFVVSWWETRARRIQHVSEVNVLGMKVMGAVPPLPAAVARHRLVTGGDEQKFYGPTFLESIDAIRTLLLRDANRDGTRVIMVTSAVEGEAKTTLSSHLATSLARAGRKTVLIDCDLRRPTLQDTFDVPLQPGFSEALLGQADVRQSVIETEGGLHVLPAGQWDREVLRILAKDGAQPLFDRLKGDFEFVVIDSHPVLAATDSLLIGQHADAVIFSLLRDRSQVHVVYAACERLASLGIRVLGAVVNGIDHDALFDQFSSTLPRYPRQ